MRRKVTYVETLNDGPEIEFSFEPIEGTLQQKKVGDKFVVAYLVQDDGGGYNPLKDYDGNGKLYTYNERVITDDKYAPSMLGLTEFSSRELYRDLDNDLVYSLGRKNLLAEVLHDPDFLNWCMEHYQRDEGDSDEEFACGCFDGLNFYTDMTPGWLDVKWLSHQEAAWDELFDAGEIGEYLAVPVRYSADCHGPGTTSIYPTSVDCANAVWVPGKCEIENMSFPPDATYAQKMEVATKYAEGCLDEYEKWCNGEVFGCVVEVFDEDGAQVDEDACWGFIGYEWASEALTKEFFEPACERVLKKYEEEIRTCSGRQKELEL